MRIIFSLFFSLLTTGIFAQFGVSAKYNSNSFEKWNDYFTADTYPFAAEIHNSGFEIGVNYWRRLKDKRIEFLPEISYSSYNSFDIFHEAIASAPGSTASMTGFNLNIPVHFYFLDLNSDCDCPTFSKQSDFLSKGLYFFLSPGISYNTNTIDFVNQTQDISESGIAYRIGAGLGYDVGLSDLLTITPFVSYNYGFANKSVHLDNLASVLCETCDIVPLGSTNLTQLQVGIRVSFRPDYQGNNF